MSGPTDRLPLGGVLVGGESRRFGSDKAAARVGDRTMVARAVETLRAVSDPVVLLGDDGTLAKPLGLPWRVDVRPGLGPLAGLATGLRWAGELRRPGLLVLACDLPLVTSEMLRTIVGEVRAGVDAVVAATHGPPGVQPLCGWYATRALAATETAIQSGRYSMRELLGALRAELVEMGDHAGDEDALLVNVNTPEDLARAIRHATPDDIR